MIGKGDGMALLSDRSLRSLLHAGVRGLGAGALAAALLLGGRPAAAQTTTVILVRHAEPETGSQDPGLSAAGHARADSLLAAVHAAGISAIYHTQYRRTRETAQAVADGLHLALTDFPVRAGQTATQHAADLAADILAKHAGQTVLVVGHSNTVPLIAAALGVVDPPSISEREFDAFFVAIKDGTQPARLLHSRYGVR